MSDFVQKLDMKRADYPKKIPVSGFGERKCNYEGMGRNVGNVYKNFREVVCVEACRTPYGVVGGKLKEYDAPQLGALAIKEVDFSLGCGWRI
jgi:acetyl-CoA C-acetyltransferase